MIHVLVTLVMLVTPPSPRSPASESQLEIGLAKRDGTLRLTFHNQGPRPIRLPGFCTLELVRRDADRSRLTIDDAFRADIPLTSWSALPPGEVRSVAIRAEDLMWAPSVSAARFTGVLNQVVKPGRYSASIHVEADRWSQSSSAVPYAIAGVARRR